MRERYDAALEFRDFLARVEKNRELWIGVHQRARVPDRFVRRLEATGHPVHLLVLSEDWCGDAVNTVPYVARLAELARNADMRILARDENPDLMDAHLTGASRSIPVVMVLNAEFSECGWWGPRPEELQRWLLGPGQLLEKSDRYREVRKWYARDQGVSTLEELLRVTERCGAMEFNAVGSP